MESDEEVTREPFEQQGDDDVSSKASNLIDNQDPNVYPLSDEPNNSTDCQIYDESALDSGDGSSAADSEDAKFAESYGVHLKTHADRKGGTAPNAYERLMNSNHFIREPEKQTGEPPLIKTSVTSDCIYHKGTFYQKGDIVAVCDQEDGQIYFAQLTGFLQDQYCEKSASLYWLVPMRPTSREFFDPLAYKIGLEDVQLRKLDCMTFVRHCPHDYYWRKHLEASAAANAGKGDPESSQPESQTKDEINPKSEAGGNHSYIWTTIEPCKVPSIKTREND